MEKYARILSILASIWVFSVQVCKLFMLVQDEYFVIGEGILMCISGCMAAPLLPKLCFVKSSENIHTNKKEKKKNLTLIDLLCQVVHR